MIRYLLFASLLALPIQGHQRSKHSSSDLLSTSDSIIKAPTKRVFLSRGWGPGGYEVQENDFSPQFMQGQKIIRPNFSVPHLYGSNRMRPPLLITNMYLAARGPANNQKKQRELNPSDYRRFHSIFTSGTWSPLGKRN